MYAQNVNRVNDIYEKAVNDNTPDVSYDKKLSLRIKPSGSDDTVH